MMMRADRRTFLLGALTATGFLAVGCGNLQDAEADPGQADDAGLVQDDSETLVMALESGWLVTEKDRAGMEQVKSAPPPPKPTASKADPSADIVDAQMREATSMELLDDTDLMGADYDSSKVTQVSQCIQLCETDDKCQSFTYARASHPRANKRNMCWLKTKADIKPRQNVTYVSGRKAG